MSADVLRYVLSDAKLRRLTKQKIKEILDTGVFQFYLSWGNGCGKYINYKDFLAYSSTGFITHENDMTKGETIEYIYKNRKNINTIILIR